MTQPTDPPLTAAGTPLTDEYVQLLADEAEAGYDPAMLIPRRYQAGYARDLPTICHGSGLRYGTEQAALDAADPATAGQLGVPFTVYRCEGGGCWHRVTSTFRLDHLSAYARGIAYHLHLSDPDGVDRDWLATQLIPAAHGKGSIRAYAGSLSTLLAEGLAAIHAERPGRIVAADRAALLRVAQLGLDGWRDERSTPC